MKQTEFYMTPDGEVMLKQEDKPEHMLVETDYEFINAFISVLQEFYTDSYNALISVYEKADKRGYRNFMVVKRFIKCNLSVYDNRIDLDEHWNFNFEFVSCPLRGECKFDGIICSPKFNSKLSDRQLEVMRLLYEGLSDNEISDKLFISLNTVNNHRKNSFKKLGVHSMSDFMRFAQKNNIFK